MVSFLFSRSGGRSARRGRKGRRHGSLERRAGRDVSPHAPHPELRRRGLRAATAGEDPGGAARRHGREPRWYGIASPAVLRISRRCRDFAKAAQLSAETRDDFPWLESTCGESGTPYLVLAVGLAGELPAASPGRCDVLLTQVRVDASTGWPRELLIWCVLASFVAGVGPRPQAATETADGRGLRSCSQGSWSNHQLMQ